VHCNIWCKWVVFASSLFAAASTQAADQPAAEPLGVSLFDRQSLTSWEHGGAAARGWQMNDGVLTGNQDSTPLLSGWTLGNFELRFRWSAAAKGQWKLLFPKSPEGQGVEFAFDAPAGDGWSEGRIVRKDTKITVTVDGKETAAVDVAADARFGLGLAVTQGKVRVTDLRLQEPSGSPLFNGKNLTGWWTPGKLESWPVIDGELVCVNKNGNYLRTEKEYGNFTLSLEYKMRKGGNSGVGIRTPRDGWPSGDGMEMQLMDEPRDKPITRHSTMAIYGNLEPIARADKSEEWNRVVIKAEGTMISAWVNGVLVQNANTRRLPELRHRHLQGWIGLQDHGVRIQFRNMNLLETPPGLGMTAWSKAPARQGSELVINRLMNPEGLSQTDGLKSHTLVSRAEGAGDHVLAELTGPGALVQVTRSNDRGTLSLVVDGNEQAAREFRAAELHQKVPALSEESRPALIYVPFRKSLKVVLREASDVEYRLDYVTFPDDVQVESYFEGRQPGVARGLLPALSYRYEQFGWGTHRENDPLPRAVVEKRNIDPGASISLSLEGTGVVRWVKVQCDAKLLTNDELWLEATVDGEKDPAISAPARYWFPGLTTGKNFRNFVMLNRNGFTNMLAMPYGQGMTVSLSNRGEKPVKNVGLQLSYEPATDTTREEMQSRMRLRGNYNYGGASSANLELVLLSGPGRWVGLVCSTPTEETAGISDFEVDGQTQAGWSAKNLTPFFGLSSQASDKKVNDKDGERHVLSGRLGSLSWRYLLLTPVDFEKSLIIKPRTADTMGPRLVLWYAAR
jgi:hypothetical protein